MLTMNEGRTGSAVCGVLIVHSHMLFREGLKGLVETRRDLKVIAEAPDGWGAVTLARRLRPELVLMEVSLNGLNAVDATRHLVADAPGVKIIGLSKNGEERLAAQMIRAGAHGYLLKDYGRGELMDAIDNVLGGDVFLNPNEHNVDDTADSPPARPKLTPREREVLALIADGHSTRQIAELLVLSTKTIETHRKHIMDKLETHSVAELTKYAIREGLSSLEGRTI